MHEVKNEPRDFNPVVFDSLAFCFSFEVSPMNHLDLLVGQTLCQLKVRLAKVDWAIETLKNLEKYYRREAEVAIALSPAMFANEFCSRDYCDHTRFFHLDNGYGPCSRCSCQKFVAAPKAIPGLAGTDSKVSPDSQCSVSGKE
jgi:hypothetical protein